MKLLSGAVKWWAIRKRSRRLDRKYWYHKQAFSIDDSPELLTFQNFLFNDPSTVDRNQYVALECSCKIDAQTVYPERFYLSQKVPQRNKTEKIARLLRFFEAYSKHQDVVLNHQQLQEMVSRFASLNITRFGFAVDIREVKEDSRIKLGAILQGSHDNILHFVRQYESYGLYNVVKESVFSTTLCCVYDFFADRRSALKIYPLYKQEHFERLVDRGVVPDNPRLRKLVMDCDAFHIGFRNTQEQKLYHFWHPRHEDNFVHFLENKTLSDVYGKIARCKDRFQITVSVCENEILSNEIVNANIYY